MAAVASPCGQANHPSASNGSFSLTLVGISTSSRPRSRRRLVPTLWERGCKEHDPPVTSHKRFCFCGPAARHERGLHGADRGPMAGHLEIGRMSALLARTVSRIPAPWLAFSGRQLLSLALVHSSGLIRTHPNLAPARRQTPLPSASSTRSDGPEIARDPYSTARLDQILVILS